MTNPAPERAPLDVTRPFTRAAALAVGMTDETLRGPHFRRVLHGIYISAAVPRRPLERVEAALVFHTDTAYVSHTSAARVYRLPVPEHLTDEHVTVLEQEERRNRRGVRAHLAAPGARVVTRRGFRVSHPEQLFLEMAGLLDLVELVAFGDALVASTPVTPERLVEVAAGFTGRRARLARRAARFVREGVDSWMESILRMLIVLAGLPEPAVNFKVRDEHGVVRLRFDLCYPGLRLIIEYDGRQHREDLAQWDADLDRDDYFDHHDWMIVRVFAWGIFKHPEKTLDRIRRAIAARGGRVPRRYRHEWRQFFPGRR